MTIRSGAICSRLNCSRLTRACQSLLLAAAAALASAPAAAALVLDQAHVAPIGEATQQLATSGGQFRRWQTFTVGTGGLLHSIEVFATGSSALTGLNLFDTLEGVPNRRRGVVTLEGRVPGSGAFTFRLQALDLMVEAGEVLAFEVLGTGLLYGDQDGYLRGSDYVVQPGAGLTTPTARGQDAYFRTWVDAAAVQQVPEPASLALVLPLLAGLLLRHRRG